MRTLCLTFVLLLSGCAAITPPPRGEKILRDLVYATHPTGAEHLDLYLPAEKAPHPLVIWIHGGGWKYGDKGWMLYLRKLTQQGFAVASVQYRLSGTAKYPAQIEDCRAAFQWLETNAAHYGLDAKNFFVAGASAGGHLAAMLALEKGTPAVRAACLLYPATDLTGFENQDKTRGYLPELLGGSVNQKRALAEQGSPVNHVGRNAPPMLIFHGDKDTLVPLAQSQKLAERLRAAGAKCDLVVLRGKIHGFTLTDEQLQQVGEFFEKYSAKK